MGIMDDIFKGAVQTMAYDPDIMPGLVLATYKPYGGTPRSCWVSPISEGRQSNGAGTKSSGTMIGVRIQNHATKGTTSINTRDTLTLAKLPGETPVAMPISRIGEESNAAEWHVYFQ